MELSTKDLEFIVEAVEAQANMYRSGLATVEHAEGPDHEAAVTLKRDVDLLDTLMNTMEYHLDYGVMDSDTFRPWHVPFVREALEMLITSYQSKLHMGNGVDGKPYGSDIEYLRELMGNLGL